MNEQIIRLLTEYYLRLQEESLFSIGEAIKTDSKRAELRNVISGLSGESSEELQIRIEKEARGY